MCDLIAAAFAMVAGDPTWQQLVNHLIGCGLHDGSEATSAGCRHVCEPDHTQHLPALLVDTTLPSTEATRGSPARSPVRTGRDRERDLGILWRGGERAPEACGGECPDDRGGLLRTSRAACITHVCAWGWGRQGGARDGPHSSPARSVMHGYAPGNSLRRRHLRGRK